MTAPQHQFPPLPGMIRGLVVALSAVTALSALGMAIAAVVIAPTPVWIMFGFEVVIAMAGVIGLLGAKGRFDDGQAMWLLCISGTVLVGGFLSYLGTRTGIVFVKDGSPVSTLLWCAGRGVLGAVFGVLAVYAVLRRTLEGRKYFGRGLIFAAFLGVVGAPFAAARGVPGFIANLPGPVEGGVLAVIGIVMTILACAAGHYFIRAFECGRAEAAPAAR